MATLGGGSGGSDLESSNKSCAASVSAAERSLNIRDVTYVVITLMLLDPVLGSGGEWSVVSSMLYCVVVLEGEDGSPGGG